MRWKRFFSAQVTAALVHQIIWTFSLRPDIHRLKNEAGCTLDPENSEMTCIPFDGIVELIALAFRVLGADQRAEPISQNVTVMIAFPMLFAAMNEVKYTETIKKTGNTSDHAITDRFYFFRVPAGRSRSSQVVSA
jgi:hypothetical protein